jgi:GGDEF domain-containing protein
VLEAIRQPIFINGTEVVVYASCGVAIYPDHSDDYNDLCRYADTAMYQAKAERDSYLLFEEAMTA